MTIIYPKVQVSLFIAIRTLISMAIYPEGMWGKFFCSTYMDITSITNDVGGKVFKFYFGKVSRCRLCNVYMEGERARPSLAPRERLRAAQDVLHHFLFLCFIHSLYYKKIL